MHHISILETFFHLLITIFYTVLHSFQTFSGVCGVKYFYFFFMNSVHCL